MKRGGREDRWSYWRDLVSKHRASGVSISAFCRERGVSEASFYAWRRRLEREVAVDGDSSNAKFVAVPLPAAASTFEVRFPSGVVVKVPQRFDEAALQRLLQAMTAMESSDA